MTVYLSYFELPDREVEISLIRARMSHNGGINGYIDNGYPFVTVELANALTITHYVSVKY